MKRAVPDGARALAIVPSDARRRVLAATAVAAALALALALAGCALPGRERDPRDVYEVVDPPEDGGGFAACASPSAQATAVPFRAEATMDAQGRGPGVHRLDEATFLFVWATYNDTLRDDRVTRVNQVDVFRDVDGSGATTRVHVCTEIDIAAPQEVDGERRSYAVAALYTATTGLPDAPVRVVVNWVAGCLCEPLPRGNATAEFA